MTMNMKQKRKATIRIAIAVALPALAILSIGDASAGTTGAEFKGLYDAINGWVTGYFGRAVALSAIALGAMMSVAKNNPIPALSGVGFAIFEQYGPTIVTGVLTATI